jgi:hypothetical protein
VDVAHDAPERRPIEEPVGRPTISGLMDQLRATMGARVHLFELEAKRAAWSAAYMLAFAVAAALLGVTAWVLLVVGLIGLAVTLVGRYARGDHCARARRVAAAAADPHDGG